MQRGTARFSLICIKKMQLHEPFITVAHRKEAPDTVADIALHGESRIPTILLSEVAYNAGKLEGRVVNCVFLGSLSFV